MLVNRLATFCKTVTVVNINVYTKFDHILSILSQDILPLIKDHNSVTNMTGNNTNLGLVNINVYAK